MSDLPQADPSLRRIFGIETEYGISVTGAEREPDPGTVAMLMFRPVVAATRSTNTYTANGSRLYLDVGSHPEYATAEATRPIDALRMDAAGERTMRRMALDAQELVRSEYGANARVHLYKNNVDSAGHSFGCHENYLVRRDIPLSLLGLEDTRQAGVAYLRSFASVCLAGLIITVTLIAFPVVLGGLNAASAGAGAAVDTVVGGLSYALQYLAMCVLLILSLTKSGSWARDVLGG